MKVLNVIYPRDWRCCRILISRSWYWYLLGFENLMSFTSYYCFTWVECIPCVNLFSITISPLDNSNKWQSRIIGSWEPEGHYHYSTMFRWEPKGDYPCTKSIAIVPFWFRMKHRWTVLTPVWFSVDSLMNLQKLAPKVLKEWSVGLILEWISLSYHYLPRNASEKCTLLTIAIKIVMPEGMFIFTQYYLVIGCYISTWSTASWSTTHFVK